MLVLTRETEQGICLYRNGELLAHFVIGRVKGKRVKLLIHAADDVLISRDELPQAEHQRKVPDAQ